jgi:hypothetical protein
VKLPTSCRATRTSATNDRFVLKRGKLSRSSGEWKDEDYDVLADDKVVGRILEGSRFGPPDLRCGWSITAIVPAIPQQDKRPRADTGRGKGEVSLGLGEGEGSRATIRRSRRA